MVFSENRDPRFGVVPQASRLPTVRSLACALSPLILASSHTGCLREDRRPQRRTPGGAQRGCVLLSAINTCWSIAGLFLLQLDSAIAPRMRLARWWKGA